MNIDFYTDDDYSGIYGNERITDTEHVKSRTD